MLQLSMCPMIHSFSSCREFADMFQVGKEDLIVTNRCIYDPYFSHINMKAHVIYQEEYGSGEPTDVMTDAILEAASSRKYTRVIAVGGGTVIDIAKVLAVSENENSVDQLYEKGQNLKKQKELIIIPTTCGTGSEVTNIAILNRTRIGTKMGLVSPAMYADHAVLIPELLESLPFEVFATSSIDALVHAVESALSPKATNYTKIFSYKAIEMILGGYRKIVEAGRTIRGEWMGEFLTASNYAGLAFGTAGCGTVHAMSYPLGGKYHVAHGESNYAVFGGVLRTYAKVKNTGELTVLNNELAKSLGCAAHDSCEALERLLNQIMIRKELRYYGVTAEDLPVFAHIVVTQQERLMANSFVPLTEVEILNIYKELL